MSTPSVFGASVSASPAGELMTVVLDDLRCVVIRLIREDDAAYFAGVDHDDREAIVGEVGGQIIAVARYDRIDTPGAAEIALLVRDDFQRHGLGTILLGELVSLAAERGITRVVAQTLIERNDVLHAMRAVGLECTSRDSRGVRTITGHLA